MVSFSWIGRLLRGGGAAAGAVAKPGLMVRISSAVAELPVIRIFVGGAVAAVIWDWWDSGVAVIGDSLGVDGSTAALMLGCCTAVCLAVVLSGIMSLFGRRR